MGRHIAAEQIRTARDLERYAVQHGCGLEHGGRHSHIVLPDGRRVSYPSHPGDIARGTLSAILRVLLAAAVVVAVVAAAGIVVAAI